MPTSTFWEPRPRRSPAAARIERGRRARWRDARAEHERVPRRRLASRPRAHVDLLRTASPSQPGRGWTDASADRRKDTISNRTVEQQAPRRRPNHPRATNPSHVCASQAEVSENLSKSAKQSAPKRQKTMEARNEALEPGMAASLAPWDSAERRKLLDAVEAHNKRWKDVAAAVGSRTWVQCRQQYGFLKKVERLVPITETTPLRAKIFKGFHASAFKKCVAKHLGDKKITTVGQLAALDLDVSKPENKLYLQKLTGFKFTSLALRMAAPWKEKAVEAIAFWQ